MYSIVFRFRSEKTQSVKKRIYVRIKVNGIPASDIPTSILIPPEQWNNEKKTIIGNSPLDYTNRAMLLKIESDLVELIRTNPNKTAKQIRNYYVGKDLPPATLFNTYQKYIKDEKETFDETDEPLAKNTIQRWYNCMNHVKEFLGNKDIELSEIDIDFGKRFYVYLRKKNQKRNKTKKIGHDYAVRNLTYLNEVIDFGRRKGLVESNKMDIHNYKRRPPKDPESLTAEQLQQLEGMKFTGILEDVRIIFLAMAYSGLNHCDLDNLESLRGKKSIVLKIERQKNEDKFIDKAIIPIFPELRKLLESIDYKIPEYHINVVNRHLHVFEGLLGVEISITTYTARKTAGMLLSERGVSIDVISRILGHSTITTTQRNYVKVVEKRVLKETEHLM